MASHQEANPIPAEVNQPPPSMEQFVRMLHDELKQTQQQNLELSRTLMEMRQQMTSTTTPTSAPVSSESVMDSTNQKRPKPRLPKPEPFTGENLSLYSQFELKLMAKLNIDGESIGTEYQKLWYAFNLLEGKAYVGSFTVSDLIEQMRKAFLDPALQDKALLRLNTLKQGNRTLREFLSEFDRLLLEAGGLGWTDNVKKGYLRAAVSYSILQGTLSGKHLRYILRQVKLGGGWIYNQFSAVSPPKMSVHPLPPTPRFATLKAPNRRNYAFYEGEPNQPLVSWHLFWCSLRKGKFSS